MEVSLANVFLQTLRDLLVDEVKFLSGVSNEVERVERDLRTIHGLLIDADNKRSNDSRSFKDCINELEQLAWKAENVLETNAVEVLSRKERKTLNEKLQRVICILCECCTVHQVGKEVGEIRSHLADLTNKLQSINGGEASSIHEERRRLLRLTFAHDNEPNFVGMEKDIKGLVPMVKDEPRHRVISICGMGGLGKTTLAKKIYNHQDVTQCFQKDRVWVCLTQQFQAETIFRDIFKQLGNEGAHNMAQTELVREIHKAMEKKKFLIVIDDIWENDHWIILKKAFPLNCKILLTTRSENVAYEERHLHTLDFLREDEGWELLRKIALPITANVDASPVHEGRSKSFEDKGRQIVQKCGRLPLAISVIGGILRQKQQMPEWEKVSSNIDSYLRRGEGIGNDTRVKLVLDLSYDALPYYLKPCFLYLACHPEDHEIDIKELYLLWMGEGLISLEDKGNNESLRDLAERYLSELAFRNMVQVEKGDLLKPHNKFESCRLHDLMRELCLSKAEEEKFIKRIDISGPPHHIPSSIGASIHRIAINLFGGADAVINLDEGVMQEVKDLRSFLVVFRNSFFNRTMRIGNNVKFENAKHLRILVFNEFKFDGGKLPSTIGKLIHLRHLSLRRCIVEELPHHVCDLPYLLTLDLRVEYVCVIKLPNLIWKMKRLRHLFLPEKMEVIGGDKLRLDGLNELETLWNVKSESACITDIINLTNIRILKIDIINEDMDSLSIIADYMNSNRGQLRHTYLIVNSCDFGSGEEGRNIVKNMLMSPSLVSLRMGNCKIGSGFPCYEQGMCQNLGVLEISDLKIGGDIDVDIDVVEELGKYPILQLLELSGVDQVMKTEMRFGANSFPELRILHLSESMNIKKWEVEKGAMPKLTALDIYNYSNLEKLPDGLRFIPTLQELYVFPEMPGPSKLEKLPDELRFFEN